MPPGTVIRSFAAPNTSPQGLTWDGRTLWCGDAASNQIYQLSVVPGASYADRVIATGPIGYWPLSESAGTIAFDISGHSPLSEQDGTYVGPTLGQPGIGDGRTAPFFDGANDRVNIYTVGLRDAFNGQEGSVMAWAKVNAVGVWTDGIIRSIYGLAFNFGTDYVHNTKVAAANSLQFAYAANGVHDNAIAATALTTWMHVVITWSVAADRVIGYLNTVVNLNNPAIGVWNPANQLGAGLCTIGARGGVTNPWHGWIAHTALWDRPLTPAEILSLGVL